MKQNEFLKAVEPQSKIHAYSLQSNIDTTPKSVHWKIPVVASVQEYGEKEDFQTGEGRKVNPEFFYLQNERFENDTTKLRTNAGIDNVTLLQEKHSKNGLDNNLVCETTFQVQEVLQYLPSHKIQETERKEETNEFLYLPTQKESTVGLKNESSLGVVNKVTSSEDFKPQDQSNTRFKDLSIRTENEPYSNESQFKQLQNSKFNYKSSSKEVLGSSSSFVQNQSKYYVPKMKTERDSGHPCPGKDMNSGLQVELESPNLKQVQALRERGVLKHQESIDKLKVALEDFGEIENKGEVKEFQEDKQNKIDKEKTANEEIVEKDEIETSEKLENLKTVLNARELNENFKPISLNSALPKQSTFYYEDKDESDEVHSGRDEEENSPRDVNEPKDEVFYPKGLDGVSYQNETYPESYYEQPVHPHNYSNLVSTVILEEDENELEADQDENSDEEDTQEILFNNQIKNVQKTSPLLSPLKLSPESSNSLDRSFIHSNSNTDSNQPSLESTKASTEIATKNKDLTKAVDFQRILIKDQDKTDSEESNLEKVMPDEGNEFETYKFAVTIDQSRSKNAENLGSIGNGFDKLKDPPQTTKTNLSHLFESDSESFQIEHGDVLSGNEDSDFDFSFQQTKG